MSDKGKFKVIKITNFSDISEKTILPKSDLAIQNDKTLFQFAYKAKKVKPQKKVIKPGVWSFKSTNMGIELAKLELGNKRLLMDVVNAKSITDEAELFFNNLKVYDELEVQKKRGVLLYSQPGCGKCLKAGTKVIMFNGSTKKVEDVIVGDLLMGPDSKPRTVMGTTSGFGDMFKVTPIKGSPYIVNDEHVLSVRASGPDTQMLVKAKDFNSLPKTVKERAKGWRSEAIQMPEANLIIDPYYLGLWLGDGSKGNPEICTMDKEIASYLYCYYESLGLETRDNQIKGRACNYKAVVGPRYGNKGKNYLINALKTLNVFNNKHIPQAYLSSSVEQRRQLLAGLLDSDGSLATGCFDIVAKDKTLADQIVFLARSLGLASYMSDSWKAATNSRDKIKNLYNRIHIGGNVDTIPTKVPRKQAKPRKQIKNVLRTGIRVDACGKDNYYGFELDKDHLFLLEDFTVTHNSSVIAHFCNQAIQEDSGTVVLVWPTSKISPDDVCDYLSTESKYSKKCTRLILILEDIGGSEHENNGAPRGVDSGMLSLLDGVAVSFSLPTFIIATTNHPENLLASLADRPGRFDLMIHLEPPRYVERIRLLEFLAKRDLTDEEKSIFEDKKCDSLSIAHLQEIVVRAALHKKSLKQKLQEILDHKEFVANSFEKKKSFGFNSDKSEDEDF